MCRLFSLARLAGSPLVFPLAGMTAWTGKAELFLLLSLFPLLNAGSLVLRHFLRCCWGECALSSLRCPLRPPGCDRPIEPLRPAHCCLLVYGVYRLHLVAILVQNTKNKNLKKKSDCGNYKKKNALLYVRLNSCRGIVVHPESGCFHTKRITNNVCVIRALVDLSSMIAPSWNVSWL